ncbi:glucosamine-6-phosphate deaminase [Pantoea rodasii]|uniref:Glucosamine-6-phosphate deaminase n=1 Tax=Pantoea rodasii TaxID=1076549 RepID=A0A2M9WAH6_9GAMM|nr:glucosamine-6-phosphate deaminase [Pantoea rodasii]ORM65721.1 glucosamine-6-phosphate deaminase [Pantoea rodasii]PJZ04498.1 glucosamine-6-phosphate deaminase [Pantoea rodasii]
MTLLQQGKRDRLWVKRFDRREALGVAAAQELIAHLQQLLQQQAVVRMVFAAAPSQREFLAALAAAPDVDWSRIHAFHMDEYIGLDEAAPQRFSHFLREHLFNRVQPGEVHLIPSRGEPAKICLEYARELDAAAIDVVCLGIGENGHLAFNDPPVADFNDPLSVKTVQLDEACRQQQVNDGCFTTLLQVPTHAVTLTIPALMRGARLFCMVPGATKRAAVQATLHDAISTACPATLLRQHPNCTLYIDTDACAEVCFD